MKLKFEHKTYCGMTVKAHSYGLDEAMIEANRFFDGDSFILESVHAKKGGDRYHIYRTFINNTTVKTFK